MASRRPILTQRLANVPTDTVWNEMTPLAVKCGAVNLGQGFPNFSPPAFAVNHLSSVVNDPNPLFHQYCRPMGHPLLVEQLKIDYDKILNRKLNENTEIIVTSGVTQGLHLACEALINPGDEVISFAPAFDLYKNDVEMSGGVMTFLPMAAPSGSIRADDWVFDESELRRLIEDKSNPSKTRTKIIIMNTPQNVPGKVWSLAELEIIRKVALDYDLWVFADEVYTSLTYDGVRHISVASLPDMFDRTLVMCSAGKTFACTGWKVGWVVGHADAIRCMNQVLAHQTFCSPAVLQIAVARTMQEARESSYYTDLVEDYRKRRDMLCGILNDVGLEPTIPSGSYFVLANIRKINPKHYLVPAEEGEDDNVGNDWKFCRWMTKVIGVNAIPTSAFVPSELRGQYDMFARFAFCKKESDIIEAGKRLQQLKNYMD